MRAVDLFAGWGGFTEGARQAGVDGDHYRLITKRELARGMGFADDYTWPEEATTLDVARGLGNAVCPPVARDLVGAVAVVA